MRILQVTFLVPLVCVSIHAAEPLIVAHRGASRDATENTLAAFQLAWDQAADAIEGDFHLTKDGHIVCFHDGNTKRMSDRDLVIKESTLEELRELDGVMHEGEDFKGRDIPTLPEVLSIVPEQKKIYIEIKCGAEILPVLLEEIEKSGLQQEQIIVISFHEDVILKLKTAAPQYKAYWLCGFKKEESGEITPAQETILDTLKKTGADGLSSNRDIPKQVLTAVKEDGYEWHIYTIDDLEMARLAREWGAKSITTNVPGYLKKNLLEATAALDAETLRR